MLRHSSVKIDENQQLKSKKGTKITMTTDVENFLTKNVKLNDQKLVTT